MTPERRKIWLRRALEIGLVLALILGVRAWMQRDTVAGMAPELAGVATGGEPLSLAALRGRPVLVHFWATWCRICALEQASIQAIARDWPVLTVATQSGDAAAVRAYQAEHGLELPVLVDEDGSLARAYGVRGVPASFVLDRDGRIRHVEVGYTSETGLRLRLWLAARGPAANDPAPAVGLP